MGYYDLQFWLVFGWVSSISFDRDLGLGFTLLKIRTGVGIANMKPKLPELYLFNYRAANWKHLFYVINIGGNWLDQIQLSFDETCIGSTQTDPFTNWVKNINPNPTLKLKGSAETLN